MFRWYVCTRVTHINIYNLLYKQMRLVFLFSYFLCFLRSTLCFTIPDRMVLQRVELRYNNIDVEFNNFTSRLWDHTIAGGGSGANLTTHVRFIVLSLLINRSGPPWISVIGSVNYKTNRQLIIQQHLVLHQ